MYSIFKIEMVILIRATSECVKILHDLDIPRGFMLMQGTHAGETHGCGKPVQKRPWVLQDHVFHLSSTVC